jgi:cytoskeletal protein RodZ
MSEIVGQQLRQVRQERNLTLDQAARETLIRAHYLEALEAGDLSQLPSKAHAKGFLRAYAAYLGLNPETLLAQLDGEGLPTQPIPSEAGGSQAAPVVTHPGETAAIFQEVGQRLSQQRELLGLSLEEVERNTRLRQHYLRALEAGDLEGLPSPVQGRGMLVNYAAFLGLDPDPLLLRFAEGLQARLAEKQTSDRTQTTPVRIPPRPKHSRLRRLFSSDFLIGGVLVLFLAGFVIWGVIRISSFRSSQEPSATVPSIVEALMPTPVTPLPETPTPSVQPTPESLAAGELPPVGVETTEQPGLEGTPATPLPGDTGAPVQVSITVLQRAWMRVTVDTEVEFEGRVLPGSAYTFAGDVQIELLTSNGAALQVFYNQTDMGVLGVYGEVVSQIYTAEGVVEPTPTITPTPTVTLLVTPTTTATTTPPPSPAP